MTKMKFKRTPTYDKEIAAKGVNVRMERYGHYIGTMRVRFYDPTLQTVTKDLDLIRRRYANKLGVDKLTDRQAVIAALAYYVILDWSDILDEKDKPVPFSPDAVVDFFEDEDETSWMFEDIMKLCTDGTKFQSIATLEDEVKN